MIGKVIIASATVYAIMLAVAWEWPAEAKIKCDGQWQIVNGQRIATPYCEDGLLATVAQQAGMRISAEAIRQNPMTKEKACTLVSFDVRVQSICSGHGYENGGDSAN